MNPTFESAAQLLFSQANPEMLLNLFDVQDSEMRNKLSRIKRNSEDIRSATTMLATIPSDIQAHAAHVRLKVLHDVCGFYRGRIATIVSRIFSDQSHLIMTNTLQVLQSELNTIIQTTTGTVREKALEKFWRKLYVRCYTGLRNANPYTYSEPKFATLQECAAIHLGTVLGMSFCTDTSINPEYTHLLDQNLCAVCSDQQTWMT